MTPFRLRQLAPIAVLLSLLSACNSPEPQQIIGEFSTQQRPGGIRLFEFRVPLARPKLRPITSINTAQQQAAVMEQFDPDRQLALTQRYLKRDPRLMEYCPHGYVTLEQYAVLERIVIRGECRYKSQEGGETPPQN